MAVYTYLKQEFLDQIERRAFSEQELAGYHAQIYKDWRRNALIWLVITIILEFNLLSQLAVRLLGIADVAGMFGPLFWLAVAVVITAILYFSKVTTIDNKKNAFVKALEKGYPELSDKYGKASFKLFPGK